MELIGQFIAWYVTVQVVTVAALPLAWRLFTNLPGRGYAFARPLGILLAGYLFWLGYAFGLLRNEPGGAWLAVAMMGVISTVAGWPVLQAWRTDGKAPVSLRHVVAVELVFLAAFVAWAAVRAHDPAVSHTEQPMDLMFMNSIRASVTYPPMDAWLAGYPVSYYYFGYWLLNTVGLLAGQPPEIAYNLGQACWYGLLLSSCFGLTATLLMAARRSVRVVTAGGLLGAIMVGAAANLQGILEWLYANGVNVSGLAALLQVPYFPEEATVTNRWFIDFGWWWWRSSRVIEDLNLRGEHIEVIDEFPAFSYILGDNHPHVTAMPFAVLAIGLALNLFLAPAVDRNLPWWQRLRLAMPLGWAGHLLTVIALGALIFLNTWDFPPYWLLMIAALAAVLLRGGVSHGEASQAEEEEPAPHPNVDEPGTETGGTDVYYPVQTRGHGSTQANFPIWRALLMAAIAGVAWACGILLLYLPYFLTAQSQAGGVVPNLFNPTRISQFVVMFGAALLAIVALGGLAWPVFRPRLRELAVSALVVYGVPIVFLAGSIWYSVGTEQGRQLLANMPLPEGATDYLPIIAGRWLGQPYTFLLLGGLTAVTAVLVWRALCSLREPGARPAVTVFVLMLVLVGMGLVYTPEFVFLRDNFGTRMNTIFKFYYQAWLLFGLAGAYSISLVLGGLGSGATPNPRAVPSKERGVRLVVITSSALSLLLVVASLIYLIAGVYSKTNGFAAQPTFDATAYLNNAGRDELNAVRWVRSSTLPGDLVLEAKGRSYRSEYNRISTMTGRPTLLGWDGHESQWRGKAYGEMAAGRPQAIQAIYSANSVEELRQLVGALDIEYVYVGPAERSEYNMTPVGEQRLRQVMDLIFASGDVHIYRVRR